MFWFTRQVPRKSPPWLTGVGDFQRHPSGCWALPWSPARLRLLARTLTCLPQAWLVIDPMLRMQAVACPDPLWIFCPRFPEEMASCLTTARKGFGGAVLLDLDEICGVWRSKKSIDGLWRTVRNLVEDGFPIVYIDLAAKT